MINALSLTALIVASISLGLGLFLSLRPRLAITLQQRFYRLINWDMKPISLEKEIRNTQIMGLFLIIVTFFVILVALTEPTWIKKYCILKI